MHVAPAVDLSIEGNDITIDDETDQFFAWFEDQERKAEQRVRDQGPSHGPAHADALPPAMPASDLPPIFPTGPLTLNMDGTEINYRKSHSGPNAAYWKRADGEEIERLLTTGTIKPILFSDIPTNRVVTYVNPICVEKTNDDGSLKFRTRLTIGGDRIIYPYDTTAVTAEMNALKILLNCMISEDAKWTTMDLTDFYLGTDLPHPEFIRIPGRLIQPEVLALHKLDQYSRNEAYYFSVHKTHYGLPQAGALSQQRLFAHLIKHGYTQIPSTPACFRNASGSIRFTLVVDDFAVVWHDQKDIDHLIHTLSILYQIKVNWLGTKYLGMTIDIDRVARHVTLTMPKYIDKLLQRVRPDGVKGASTPAVYTPPNYGNPGAQKASVDDSNPANDEQKKLLQSVIGTLLYYSRAVDPSICTAVHELGSVQSKPTENDMAKMERLLQYVSRHRNNGIRFYASSMILQSMSDASYLCRPRARSVFGCTHYLGDPDIINGPIACGSWMISCVVSSVAEAELAGGFQAAQMAVQLRNILHDLGYPQLPTLLRIDNTVAIGLARGSINAKRSKSMDMRFFWLADRVKQNHFTVEHIPGIWNVADHFTKPLPKGKFYQFFQYLAVNTDNEPQPNRLKSATVTIHKIK